MLAKRIIPCLDVRDGQVVKGVQFRNHEIIGVELTGYWTWEQAQQWRDAGIGQVVYHRSRDAQAQAVFRT